MKILENLSDYMSAPKANSWSKPKDNTDQSESFTPKENYEKSSTEEKVEPEKLHFCEEAVEAMASTNQTVGRSLLSNEELMRIKREQTEFAQKLMLGYNIDNVSTQFTDIPFQEALALNIGEYVVIDFLIGTNMIVKKQGLLFNVGISYLTLFDDETKTFITCDFFSIKFVTFYLPGQRPPKNQHGNNTMTPNIPPNGNGNPPVMPVSRPIKR